MFESWVVPAINSPKCPNWPNFSCQHFLNINYILTSASQLRQELTHFEGGLKILCKITPLVC